MRDSVPSGSYSSVCNVLRQWKSCSSLLIESTDSMIHASMQPVLEPGSIDIPLTFEWFDTTQFHTSLFTFQSNCAKGLHFSAFHLIGSTVPSRGVTIDNRTYSCNIYGVSGCVQTIFVKK